MENVHFVWINRYIKCWKLLVNNAFGELKMEVFGSIRSVILQLTKNWKMTFGQHTFNFSTQAPNVHV